MIDISRRTFFRIGGHALIAATIAPVLAKISLANEPVHIPPLEELYRAAWEANKASMFEMLHAQNPVFLWASGGDDK